MTDNIQAYVNIFISNKYFSQSQSTYILQMYYELKTYEYNDIFIDHDLTTINTSKLCQSGSIKNVFDSYTRLNSIYFKTTVINSGKVYKMLISSNNNSRKDILILNFLKEIYFHKTFRDTIIANNIEHVIVPEIYRYGIINLANHEFAIFYETYYYIDEQPPQFDAITNRITFINNMKTLFSLFREGLITINRIETELNIKHNDIMHVSNYLDDRYFEQAMQLLDINLADSHEHPYNIFVEDIARRIQYYNGKFNLNTNIIKYNNKIVLIDFEKAGTIENIPNIFNLIDKM